MFVGKNSKRLGKNKISKIVNGGEGKTTHRKK